MAWCMKQIRTNPIETKKCESLQYWIPSLNLLPEDHQDIVGRKWLSDNAINAAQKLLKARHSSIGGLRTCNFRLKEEGLYKS